MSRQTATEPRYASMSANGGERSVIVEGFVVQAVFVGPTHAELAERVVKFLNEDEREENADETQ